MLMIRGETLFDGARSVDVPTITIDGDRIVAIGDPHPPPDVEMIELEGATLLPGLVDCHQHLCFETVGEECLTVSAADAAQQARASAQRALAVGVTTIRDLGDKDYASLSIRGEPNLPTILCAGPPITVPEGHCWYLGGEVDPAAGEAALRAAVRERADNGCDVVKIMMTGGFLTPTNPMWHSQFSLDDLRVVVDEAHGHGLPVAAHCHGVEGIEQAVRAGVDTIEHCSFLDEELGVAATTELLTLVAESRIPASVTIGRLPEPPLPEIFQANIPDARAARGKLHELGGIVVPGTDAGIGPAKPHDVMPLALAELVACGLSPSAGLEAMTAHAAGAAGVASSKGRLAPGHDADILALAGDPLIDIDAIHEPVAVWCRGDRVNPG